MNAVQKLDLYLAEFSGLLRRLALLKGAASLAGVLLVVGSAGAWFSRQSGLSGTTTNVFRLILLVALGAAAFFMLVKPLRQLRREASAFVEARVPDFNGRIETYAQMKARDNPFLELLAEDTLK